MSCHCSFPLLITVESAITTNANDHGQEVSPTWVYVFSNVDGALTVPAIGTVPPDRKTPAQEQSDGGKSGKLQQQNLFFFPSIHM